MVSAFRLESIGVFKARQQGGPKRIFLLICFDDHSNPVPTNGKSVPTKLLLNLPGGAVAPPGPLGKYAYAPGHSVSEYQSPHPWK